MWSIYCGGTTRTQHQRYKMFLSSIQQRSCTTRGSDLTWAAVSCLGLQALLDESPDPISYIADAVHCFTRLINKLLLDDHGQPLQLLELPLESLGYAAVSVGPLFTPYLESTIMALQEIFTHVPLSSCESAYWTAGGVMGDCIMAVGGEAIQPHLPFFAQNILTLGESTYPRLKLVAYRVLTRLVSECPGSMSLHLDQLVSMLSNSIGRVEPNIQSLSG